LHQDVDQPAARLVRDRAVLVDDLAQAEKLTSVAQRLDEPEANERNEQMDAVVADVDCRADGNVRIAARLVRLGQGRAYGRTVIQRPFQSGALRWTFSVNFFLNVS
jgi:hypothetical protein